MSGGHATTEATQAYAKRHGELTYQQLGTTGLWVSQAGFGCYRVDVAVDEHRAALKKALLSGVNLIDTSANYADGGSEELVGSVLAELIARGEIARAEVVVVSKVGYLQGQNYQLSQQRKQAGRPFPDLVLYGEGLEHCLHPEFLADQLTRSLQRLQLEALDCYLLHNPEYYLGWAKKAGLPLAEARAEYDRRIELAFRHLEHEVTQGRIRSYGISSNTFPAAADDPQFTSLEKILAIAEAISPQHHFRVIQLPMNLCETGGVTEINQSTPSSVVAFAASKRLGVLINRPLNALVGNSITRLAEVQGEGLADAKRRISQIPEQLQQLRTAEQQLQGELLPKLSANRTEQSTLVDRLAAGALLAPHWRRFQAQEHWQQTLAQFVVPTVQNGIQLLRQTGSALPEVASWLDSYVEKVNAVLQAITLYYQQQAQQQAQQQVTAIKAQVAAADRAWGAAATLSQMAIRALRSTEGITTVLVGMRRADYVEDVLQELIQPVAQAERNAAWAALKIAP